MKLELTKQEEQALLQLIYNGKPCSNGCVYPHMQNSKKDCDECEYTKSIDSILDKIKECDN